MKKLMLSLMLMLATMAQAQLADSIAARLALQRYTFPQEKIHVMTDKPRYMAGDTIWLRAWTVDASTHQPVDASRFVYVELKNPLDTVTTRIKLRGDKGAFSGYLPLSPEMAEGSYQLSAYTLFMQSLGEAYFYKQMVEVVSPLATRYTIAHRAEWDGDELLLTLNLVGRPGGEQVKFQQMGYALASKDKWYSRSGGEGTVRLRVKGRDLESPAILVAFDNYKKYIAMPRRGDDLDITFYPEGGYLVPGVECATTFKVMASDGSCAEVNGRIVDADGNEVAALNTEHDGMGLVRFTPRLGVSYMAEVRDAMGREKRAALPAVRDNATVLHVKRSADSTIVHAVGAPADKAVIVVQERGQLLAVGQGMVVLDNGSMPTGVVQALLLDELWKRLSERMFFNIGDEPGRVAVTTNRPTYDSRELVQVRVAASGFGVPQGDYAVSVTDNRSVTVDSVSAMRVNLLLQSELQGRIHNPAYYFETDSTGLRAHHLDLLMRTQGWRRYDVLAVMRGRLAEPAFPLEQAQVVSGRVVSLWRKRPLENAAVNLLAPKIGVAEATSTDADGRFEITLKDYPDSVKCVLQAFNVKGKREMNLEIDKEEFPYVVMTQPAVSANAKPAQAGGETDWLLNELQRVNTIDGMRHIVLAEVEVAARKKRLPEDMFEAMAKVSLSSDELQARHIASFRQFISRVPGLQDRYGIIVSMRTRDFRYPQGMPVGWMVDGVQFAQDESTERIPRHATTGGSNEPSYGLFGITTFEPVLAQIENSIPFETVKRIDYLQPSQSMTWGFPGGMIVIETKDGGMGWNMVSTNSYLQRITMLGYQSPVAFYAPRYETGGNGGLEPGNDLRNTLYWNPRVTWGGDGTSAFEFYTNDQPSTSYTITIEGITNGGELYHATHSIGKK